ncbi:MAG: hypothetical protein WBA87_07950 [Microbacterium sp.]
MADPTETWAQRKARLESESYDSWRAREVAEYDHNHDKTGHYLRRDDYTPDASLPRDPFSGVYIGPDTKPWHHFVGHPQYQPHPDSIAAGA